MAVEDDVVKTPSSSRERRGKDTDSVRSSGISKRELVCTQSWLILQLITHFHDISAKTLTDCESCQVPLCLLDEGRRRFLLPVNSAAVGMSRRPDEQNHPGGSTSVHDNLNN